MYIKYFYRNIYKVLFIIVWEELYHLIKYGKFSLKIILRKN